jgi:hypothetical protein
MKTSRLAFALLFVVGSLLEPVLLRAAIPAPDDVAAPPADASRTPSGLASRVLTEGSRDGHGPLHRMDYRRQDVR